MATPKQPPMVAQLDALRRRWALASFGCLLVLAVIVPLALGLPEVYRASANILVEGPLFEALGSDAVEFDSRLQAIKQEALSRARLTTLIEQFDLYRGSQRKLSLDDALGRMQRDIQVEITSVSQRSGQPVAFRLSYLGSDSATVA